MSNLLDRDALRPGLLGDHAVAEHELAASSTLFARVAELDETGFAASAGENLRFHHHLGSRSSRSC
jgi:hypothetical protein